MKYTLQSSKYVFKNFIYLFPFAILPAIFLAVSTDEGAILNIIKALLAGNISSWSFTMLFKAISLLNFASWQSIVFGLVGIHFAGPIGGIISGVIGACALIAVGRAINKG